tara:strand:+ start:2542 stop:3528 length:987 start_codon:yes stop_codon:yes gene_type:complete
MKYILLLSFFCHSLLFAQHTFSIVAIDPITGEIGSAGATCGDNITWPGTPGAALISDIIPGKGAVHTQSYWNSTNQYNAHQQLLNGASSQEIIDWLVANDSEGDASVRQYGAITTINDSITSAAFTGSNCFDYKNHHIGDNYSIQGNILLGQSILDSMESRFVNTDGSLANKLMASLQGAKVIGADTRCTIENVSSLSAFLRIAQEDDNSDNIYLDIIVPSTLDQIDPIDSVQTLYNTWQNNIDITQVEKDVLYIFPNPTNGDIIIKNQNLPNSTVMLFTINGQKLLEIKPSDAKLSMQIGHLSPGLYLLKLSGENRKTLTHKIVLRQ